MTVFAFADDYSFGILQSGIHWAWFTAKCSTLTERFRYTSDTVFDTFPWPQFEMGGTGYQPVPSGNLPDGIGARGKTETPGNPAGRSATLRGKLPRSTGRLPVPPMPDEAISKIRAVASAAVALRKLRHEIMSANGWSLRELYKSLETPGENRLRDAHAALDAAVRAAYGMKPDEDILAFLLKLNLELADKEAKGEPITPPGLPSIYPDAKKLVTEDCIKPAGL